MQKSFENLKKINEEYEKMSFAYHSRDSRPMEAKFHLDKSNVILAKMDEVFSANCSLEQKFNLIEEHIRNFKNYSDWFEATGNLKLSEENLNTAMIKIEEYRTEIEETANKERQK